jgi:hypothetical protein
MLTTIRTAGPIAYTNRTQPPAIATDANVDNIIVAKVDGESQFIATLGRLWCGSSRSWLALPQAPAAEISRADDRDREPVGRGASTTPTTSRAIPMAQLARP